MKETYKNDAGDVLYYVIYATKKGVDEVLQHKKHGSEMAHITKHPDGFYFRETRNGNDLKRFVRSGLDGFSPSPSPKLKQFLMNVRSKI